MNFLKNLHNLLNKFAFTLIQILSLWPIGYGDAFKFKHLRKKKQDASLQENNLDAKKKKIDAILRGTSRWNLPERDF